MIGQYTADSWKTYREINLAWHNTHECMYCLYYVFYYVRDSKIRSSI